MKTLEQRRAEHEKVSKIISEFTQEEVIARLKAGTPINSSMGAAILEIEGVSVFAKQIAISDFELKNATTRNLFGLPSCYQHAFNSAGFGAYRELTAHQMTTDWVLKGECLNFPLTYGFAMVPREGREDPVTEEEFKGVKDYWNGSEAVDSRLRAIEGATKSVVVFMEAIPKTLNSYIHPKASEDGSIEKPDMAMLEREIKSTTDFMESKGMMHCDAHSGNILTDGEHIYFADFGMVLSLDFELSPEEEKFFQENLGYDRSQALSSLCRHPKELPILPEVMEVSERYKEIATRFKAFTDSFRDDSTKSVTYPAEEMRELHKKVEFIGLEQAKKLTIGIEESEKELIKAHITHPETPDPVAVAFKVSQLEGQERSV